MADTPTCSLGLEYSQIRAYLRLQGEGQEHAPLIWDHIRTCDSCWPKWEFLSRTDPIVRRQFEERIGSVIDEVQAQEIIIRPDKAGVQEWLEEMVEAMKRSLGQVSRRPLPGLGWLAKALEPFSFTPAFATVSAGGPDLDSFSVIATADKLEFRDIVRLCDSVRETPDDEDRFKRARGLAESCRARLERSAEVGNNPLADAVIEARSKKWVDLTELKAPPEDAVAFVASFPLVSFCQEPKLLELRGEKPIFHSEAFFEMMPEFQSRWMSLLSAS